MDDGAELLVVWCGECEADRRWSRSRLGQIRLSVGILWWGWKDHRARELARKHPDRADRWLNHTTGWQILRHPDVSEDRLWVARLEASCRRHGNGQLDTAEVLAAALGASQTRKGSIVLTLLRT